jgi:uncharacterized BrkB/YihY/UPF0761 family membrane protein
MRHTGAIIKRTVVSFYDDQMTHHAAALTYYSLMSLFPAGLLALSLLGLVGQYPSTYDAIIGYLRDVAPRSVVGPLDSSLRTALQAKGTATTALAISVVVAALVWNLARWPAAVVVAMWVFAYIYYVTPDVRHRSFRWVTPGATVGVLLWLAASYGLSIYLSEAPDVGALYGAFTGAIVLVGWLWLTNVALLFGAELNAEIERQRELAEGVPQRETLNRPASNA